MLAFPVLTLLLCVLAVVHLGVGARTISPQTVVQALFHFDAKISTTGLLSPYVCCA
jgi:iron complex transport system permease protein